MNRRWLYLMVVVACVGCKYFLPMHPKIGIEVQQDGWGGYVLTFTNCLNDAELPIDEVEVYNAGEGQKGGVPICQLVSGEPGRHPLKVWKYGKAPTGYELKKCAPLTPGKTYDAHASGSGIGVRRFALAKDGKVSAQGSKCD